VIRTFLHFPLFGLLTALIWGNLCAQERGEAGASAVIDVRELARAEAGSAGANRQRAVHAPKFVPRRSVAVAPAEAATVQPMRPLAAETGAAASYTGFRALLDNFTRVPPDTEGAVGPQHVVTMLNSEVQVQDRNGAVLSKLTLDQFWSALGPFGDVAFDPRILYDAAADRWIASAAADAKRSTSAPLVGASQTGDPAGKWNVFRIDIGGTGNWGDYPVLGFNGQWVAVSVNLFQAGDNGGYARTNLYVFDKAQMYRGARAPYALFTDQSGTFVPALDYDGLNNRMLLAQAVERFSGAGALRISEVRGAVGAETFSPGSSTVGVNDYWAGSAAGDADFAPQMDSAALIDTGDDRIQNCVYRSASLWCAQTVFLPAGAPTRTAAQWWQVNVATGQVMQRGRVDDPAGKYFYAYPSIAVNRNGDAVMGFTRFAAGEYASAAFAFRAAGDAPGAMQPEVVFKAGEAAYRSNIPGAKSNRWGDYSATVVDPADDLGFWTIQQYAASVPSGLNGRWGTWWAHVLPPGSGCTYTLSSTAQLMAAAGGSGTVTVSTGAGCAWSAASNAAWITAGSGGSGTGALSFTVQANASATVRTGTLTIAGQTFTVTQAGAAAQPDVVVTEVTAAAAALAGAEIPVSLRLRNQGSAAAGPFSVGLYWTAGPGVSTRDALAVTCPLPGLPAGGETSCHGNAVVPASLAPGTWYLGAIAGSSTRLSDAIAVLGTAPRPVNAASYEAGPVAPGEIVTFFGPAIGPAVAATLRLTGAGRVDTVLGDTRVLFDGVPAPMIYAQAAQVSAVVPFGIAGRTSTQVQIEYRGVRSAAFTAPVAAAAPALFSLDASGRGGGAFLNQDGTVNGPARPAVRGEVVVLYANGLGQMSPVPGDGEVPVAPDLPRLTPPPTVRIGGVLADVVYAGAAPGMVAGVVQINVRVPDGVAPGDAVPVEIQAGGAISGAVVTLAVR
jgi:uncharacterized protein (TIGR03437 family)